MSRTDPAPFPAVLIVEDDPTIRQHLQLGLQGHGYPTTWCRTGAAALIHVTEAKPRIVLLDLGLPDLDGVERARYVTTAGRTYCGHRHGVETAESVDLGRSAESQRRVAGVSRSTTSDLARASWFNRGYGFSAHSASVVQGWPVLVQAGQVVLRSPVRVDRGS